MATRVLKVLSMGLGALILLLVLAGMAIMVLTNSTVGTAISVGAANALGTPVSLRDVGLAPLREQITFRDLVVDYRL